MRHLLTSLFAAGSLLAMGQENTLKLQRQFIPVIPVDTLQQKVFSGNLGILTGANFSHSLANGNKVYRLPLDNMPCVVPDIKQFNMPNTGSPEIISPNVPGAIPNPGYKEHPVVVMPPSTSKTWRPSSFRDFKPKKP